MCVFYKEFKCMSAKGMLLHAICVMCVCTYTRLNPHKQTPNERGTRAERKNNPTHTTHATHRHHPGGGRHTNGVKKTPPRFPE